MKRSTYSTSMWADACATLAEAERLHRRFFDLAVGSGSAACATWEPPVDVYELGPSLTVWVALPGVPPDKTTVEIESGRVRISAERPLDRQPRAAVIRRLEIPHGRLERIIELPTPDYELLEQETLNGCLRLLLRRS